MVVHDDGGEQPCIGVVDPPDDLNRGIPLVVAERWPFPVTLALSAFESNQTSLQLLQHLPVTFIKLAPRYIGEGLRNPALREELRQLVALAHEQDRKIIAPRIEDAQSASLLWTAGVDYIQGDFVQQAGQDMSFDFHAIA